MTENHRFGSLTGRMNAYREAVLEKKPYIDAERALLCTEVYRQNRHQPAVMKRALMLKNILEKMTIYIEEESILVGNQASANRNAPIFPEYTLDFVIDELGSQPGPDPGIMTEIAGRIIEIVEKSFQIQVLRSQGRNFRTK